MLDDSSPVPLYHQLYSLLREQIASNPEAFQGRFPSEHELKATYGVSRVTVRNALERLEADGVIVRRPGRGTFLNPAAGRNTFIARDLNRLLSPEAFVDGQDTRFSVTVLEAQQVPPSQDVAASLRLAPGQTVLALRRLVKSNGQPTWIETRYLPSDIAEGLRPDDFAEYSVLDLLADRRGIRVTDVDMDVFAGAASAMEARRLEIRAGAPVLITRYTSFAGEQPIQTGRSVFRGDRYKFRTRISAQANQVRPSASVPMGIVRETAGVSAADHPPERTP